MNHTQRWRDRREAWRSTAEVFHPAGFAVGCGATVRRADGTLVHIDRAGVSRKDISRARALFELPDPPRVAQFRKNQVRIRRTLRRRGRPMSLRELSAVLSLSDWQVRRSLDALLEAGKVEIFDWSGNAALWSLPPS